MTSIVDLLHGNFRLGYDAWYTPLGMFRLRAFVHVRFGTFAVEHSLKGVLRQYIHILKSMSDSVLHTRCVHRFCGWHVPLNFDCIQQTLEQLPLLPEFTTLFLQESLKLPSLVPQKFQFFVDGRVLHNCSVLVSAAWPRNHRNPMGQIIKSLAWIKMNPIEIIEIRNKRCPHVVVAIIETTSARPRDFRTRHYINMYIWYIYIYIYIRLLSTRDQNHWMIE